MKNLNSFYLLTLTFATLTACAPSNDTSQEIATAPNTSPTSEVILEIDQVTENRFAYLKNVEKLNSEFFVAVDYVDYLTGQEALDAEWRDEAYFVDGKDTITNITNGYYISNQNPKLRTFKLKNKISVENVIDDEGVQVLTEPEELNLNQIEEYIKDQTLLFLHIKKGIIVRVDKRYLP